MGHIHPRRGADRTAAVVQGLDAALGVLIARQIGMDRLVGDPVARRRQLRLLRMRGGNEASQHGGAQEGGFRVGHVVNPQRTGSR